MKIVIWGAGKFGRYIKEQLAQREDVVLLGFIDRSIPLNEEIDGLKVISLLQAKEQQADLILIAIVDFMSVYNQLQQKDMDRIGIIQGKVYTMKKKLSENILEDKNILWLEDIQESGKPILEHLETNVMDCCNLNCKGCSHFSNLFAKNASIPFETFSKDLQQIAEHAYIVRLYLLGGEPLLNQGIERYLEFSRKTLPSTDIQIVSNGLLLPKQSDSFFECCRENEISISISGYEPTLSMKEKIESVLKVNQVEYSFRGHVLSFGKNIDLQGNADPEKAFVKCREHKCHFFRKGRLYKCPFEALGNFFFSHYNIDIQFDGGVDIYNDNLEWDKLVKRLDTEAIESCCYCGEEERMEWEIKNHPELEDWVVKKK